MEKSIFNTFQIMALGFAVTIFVGTLILMLPASTTENVVTPFIDALFTATTSVCVTGLVVRETGTYWSIFGQTVLLILIQVGGLGVVTVAASFALLSGRRIGLFQKGVMREAVAAPQIGGILHLILFIIKSTFLVEAIGAVCLLPVFINDFGIARGMWMSMFHSISAFCNAGIDLMGIKGSYSSLTAYRMNPSVNIVIMSLIISGGLGFLTWDDIRTHRCRIKKYRMQSKLILCITAFLILVPAVGFFIFEFADYPLAERIYLSIFQSVTTRTAGFNTADLQELSESGKMIMILLMLVGGSPGSTAGGMKTTTFAVLAACVISVFRRQDNVHCFGRRIAQEAIFMAVTLALMYGSLCVGGAILLNTWEKLPLLTCMFETASAIATVGLTLGITTQLSVASKCLLIVLMYIWRVGGLTIIYAAITKKKRITHKFPLEKITIG